MTYLSHNHYAVSDKMAGKLARATKLGRLPRHGYELDVETSKGPAVLKRTTLLTTIDPIKNKRGWVWTVMPTLPA